jgi:hypothetical protein
MLTRRKLIVGALAAAVVLAPLQAYAASWVTLGSRTVNLIYDHDSIHVGLTSGLFTKIRLKVTGNTVFMRDLHVTFSSGAGFDVPIRFLFLPGTSSRVIDLPGAARFIRRVDMTYSKLPGGGTALVTLLGYKL